MTTVVHCKRDFYDVLIDRTTKWGNPYEIGRDGLREEVIEKYRNYILSSPLLNDIHELKDKVLGCWCKPLACHGDVLKEICDNLPV
jgi:hypothetical protein